MRKSTLSVFIGLVVLLLTYCAREFNNPIDPGLDKPLPPEAKNLELFAIHDSRKVQGRFSYDYPELATKVIVERKIDGGTWFIPVDTLAGDTVFIDSVNLEYSTRYAYRLYATNVNGVSPYTESFTVRTSMAPDTAGPAIVLKNPKTKKDSLAVDTIRVMVEVNDTSGVKSVLIKGDTALLEPSSNRYYKTLKLKTGFNNFSIVATDKRENISVFEIDSIYFDSTLYDSVPPVITVQSIPDTVTSSSITLRGTVTDTGSSVKSILVNNLGVNRNGNGFEYLADNLQRNSLNTFIITAQDNSTRKNTINDTVSVYYFYDSLPPLICINNFAKDSLYVTTQTVGLNGTYSDPSGIYGLTVNFKRADTSNGNWTYSYTLDAYNTWTKIEIIAIDNSPQRNRDTISRFMKWDSTINDSVAPVISIQNLAKSDTVTSSYITLQGTVTDNYAGVATIKINGANVNRNGNNFTYNVNALQPNVANMFVITAEDNSLRKNTSRETLYVYYLYDTLPPVFTLTNPTQDSLYIVNRSITLGGSYSDVSGLRILTVNFTQADTAAGNWTYGYTIDAYNIWRKIEIIAEDDSPQRNKDTLIRFVRWDSTYYDHTPPVIKLKSHSAPDTIGQLITVISGVALDSNHINGVWVNGQPAALSDDSVWVMSGVHLITPVDSELTTMPITVVAEDKSRSRNRDTLQFNLVFDIKRNGTVDRSAPYFTVKNGAVTQPRLDTVFQDAITFNGDINDPSGIDSFYVKVNNDAPINLTKGNWSYGFTLKQFRNVFVFISSDSIGNANRDSIVVLRDYENSVNYPLTDTLNGKIRLTWQPYTVKDYQKIKIWVSSDNGADTSVSTFLTTKYTENSLLYTPADPSKDYTFTFVLYDSLNQGVLKKHISNYLGLPKGMVFVFSKSDTFNMGDNDLDYTEPAHMHPVLLTYNFWIDSSEVTQEDYFSITGVNRSYYRGVNLPAENMTWFDAVLYCNARSKRDHLDTVYTYSGIEGVPFDNCTKLVGYQIDYSKNGYRLPTEAEWEYSCRAGTETDYYFGNSDSDLGQFMWYTDNSNYTTHAVKLKIPNSLGLYDMHGNVAEMCNDINVAYTSPNLAIDPLGGNKVGDLNNIIERGGSFSSGAYFMQSSFRIYMLQSARANCIGFRCVRR